MHKVKNAKVIRRIADKTRKAGKTRNLIAILAIALTSILFTTVFTVGGSLIEKQQEATMRQVGGSCHAGFKYLTQEEYDIVKQDAALKEISYRIVVGNVVNEELKKLHTELSYYEDQNARASFCYPQVGNMPQKKDEIVASDLVLKALGVPCEIGTKLSLTIDIGGVIREDTFTLSGYFPGDTVSQAQIVAVSKEYANEVAPTPTTSAMGQSIDSSQYPGRIMADFNFATSMNLEKQTADLISRCGFPEDMDIGINWAYMGGNLDPTTVFLVLILLTVILISGYLIIYNIFYINVFQDIRYYGLLKTIGTTGKQLRKIVRRQAFMLSLYGIPIGLLGGIIIGKLILPVVMGTLNVGSSVINTEVRLNVWIFAGSALFSLITVYISCIKPCRIASKVSPVEAIRFTEGQNITDKARTKRKFGRATNNKTLEKKTHKVSPKEMALQNVKRNKKKVVIVVASLSLALVLLNSIFSLVNSFDMDLFVANMTVSDFSVADATVDNLSVNSDAIVMDGVTVEMEKALQAQKGVEEIGNVYLEQSDLQFTEEDFSKIEERILDNPQLRGSLEALFGDDTDQYIEYLKNREAFISGKTYGIGDMIVKKLENVEGEVDLEKFSTGNYVIVGHWVLSELENTLFFEPGETVTLFNANGESREYEILAVADLPYACEFQHYGAIECNYLLPEQEFLDFIGQRQPMRTLFDVEPEHEAAIEQWISDYCENVNSDLAYNSKAQIVREFDAQKNMYAMVGGLLAFILAIIGILNFINTMSTSILSRKQEFAMMEAVGMTGKQLRDMLCYEGTFYALLTGIFSLILGGLLNMTVIRSIGSELFFFRWKFTVMPILICIPILFILVLWIPTVCCKNMRKTSVVERMRKPE